MYNDKKYDQIQLSRKARRFLADEGIHDVLSLQDMSIYAFLDRCRFHTGLNETIDELIARLDVDMEFGNRKLEERLESVKKTRFIIDKINEAVSLIRKSPDDGERLYNVLYLTYISPEKLSHFDLLYRLDVSTRHYYRLREKAVNKVSQRLWSAPDKETDYWIEILMILQES